MIEINIQIIDVFNGRQWMINKDVVYIEGVFWQLQFAITQHLGTVDNRVHQNILAFFKFANLFPGKKLILRQNRAVVHNFFMSSALFVVNKVGNEHIQLSTISQHLF